MWKLFKETVLDVYHFGESINEEFILDFENKK